jgi:hypothetical protein
VEDVIAMIDQGALDDEFEAIQDAISQRREVLNKRKMREVRVGEAVKFNEQARPQYLIGHVAVVVAKNYSRIVIELTQDVGKYRQGVPITTPLAIVDRVEVTA